MPRPDHPLTSIKAAAFLHLGWVMGSLQSEESGWLTRFVMTPSVDDYNTNCFIELCVIDNIV